MSLRTKLMGIAKAVSDQAARDLEFAERLATILGAEAAPAGRPELTTRARPKNRRARAVLDPVAIAREGEAVLRKRLEALSLEQIKDIIADFGMDPSKRAMKWKKHERVLDHVVESSLIKASKGDAFRA